MELCNTSISVSFNEEINVNDTSHNVVITGVTYNNKSYAELNVFAKKYKQSVPNLRRKLSLVPENASSQYFLRVNGKLFVNPALLQVDKSANVNLGEVGTNWASFIGGFEWDLYGTVNYQNKYSLETAKQRAEKYFKKLKIKYRGKQIRMFYALENNGDPFNGFHMHFLIWVDVSAKAAVKSFTEGHFRGKGQRLFANTHMVKYDPAQGAIFYMLKELHMHNGTSIDFLTHNILEME